MATDHILYLTSSANLEIFPNNHPSDFTNRIPIPIVLENNIEYEVGLISILYPDQYYGILANNGLYNITVFTEQESVDFQTLHVELHQNILSGDLEKIYKLLITT